MTSKLKTLKTLTAMTSKFKTLKTLIAAFQRTQVPNLFLSA